MNHFSMVITNRSTPEDSDKHSCGKPKNNLAIREWFIPTIYGDIGDGLQLALPQY